MTARSPLLFATQRLPDKSPKVLEEIQLRAYREGAAETP